MDMRRQVLVCSPAGKKESAMKRVAICMFIFLLLSSISSAQGEQTEIALAVR